MNSHRFTYHFLIQRHHICIFYFISLSKILHKMLNTGGDHIYLCYVPDLRRKTFIFHNHKVDEIFHRFPLSGWICFLLFLFYGFYQKWMLDFGKRLCVSIEIFIFFLSLMHWITFDFQMLNLHRIPEIFSTWSWCISFLRHCSLWFSEIFFRICAHKWYLFILLWLNLCLTLVSE